jgi:uncharacterized membrane protein YvbJ
MLCTGCGIQSADSESICGGCSDSQRSSGNKDDNRTGTPAIFQVGQAIQRQADPDRNKRWQRAQRLWSQCAIACILVLIIFVIGSQ